MPSIHDRSAAVSFVTGLTLPGSLEEIPAVPISCCKRLLSHPHHEGMKRRKALRSVGLEALRLSGSQRPGNGLIHFLSYETSGTHPEHEHNPVATELLDGICRCSAMHRPSF